MKNYFICIAGLFWIFTVGFYVDVFYDRYTLLMNIWRFGAACFILWGMYKMIKYIREAK